MTTATLPPPDLRGAVSALAASLDATVAGLLADPLATLSGLASRLDFAALVEQRGRLLQIATALPQLALVPERAVMREAVGQPFELVVDCISTSAYFELKRLIGEQMSLRLLQSTGQYQPWHGYVFEAAQLGADGGLARYRLVMRPWLGFLALRRDCFIHQDRDAREILEDTFADHPQARWRFEVSEPLRRRSLCVQYRETDLDFMARLLAEEGLSYHFEHDDSDAPLEAATGALHTLVITDRLARRPDLGSLRFSAQHPTANIEGQRDAVTAFAARRQLQPNAVTLGAWNYKQLAGSSAETATALDIGELPELEQYDGAGAYRYQDATQAERAAGLALAALELDFKRFEGQGSVRHLAAGARFTLIDHALYGAGASGAAVDPVRSHLRPDNQFTVLAVEHHATNNLGAQAAQLLEATALEHGTYRNHFHCAPAAAAVVPRFVRKPTAPGLQTALVVGPPGEPLHTERDLRVKVQFPWQRGRRPLPGGLGHDIGSPDAEGNAPGDQASGTWVRVAGPAAGANWGTVFTPRLGTEVVVEFIEGDIDRPVVVGSLYNGQDLPPYSAGVDAGVNHPGVISGLHSHALDGAGFNQWVVDDASGQLRMRLLCSYTAAEVGLGHLIEQSETSAQRGGWRGSGFEVNTQGWGSLRAAQGVLLTSTSRAGSYGSALSTQMDAAEALARLQAARSLGGALSKAARQGRAQGLASHDAGQALQRMADAMDPTVRGRHEGTVGGQTAQQQDAARGFTEPVHALADPLVVVDTPSAAALSSPAQLVFSAGQHHSATVAGDLQASAGHTHSTVAGSTLSLYAHEGGVKAYAANGPVSLRAHSDSLQLLADQQVTIVSVNDEVHLDAQQRIEIHDGHSSIVLEGGNITLTMPGLYTAPTSTHEFMAAGGAMPQLPVLPAGLAQRHDEQFRLVNRQTGAPLHDVAYDIRSPHGLIRGRTDIDGRTERVHTGGDAQALNVTFTDEPNHEDFADGQSEGC